MVRSEIYNSWSELERVERGQTLVSVWRLGVLILQQQQVLRFNELHLLQLDLSHRPSQVSGIVGDVFLQAFLQPLPPLSVLRHKRVTKC